MVVVREGAAYWESMHARSAEWWVGYLLWAHIDVDTREAGQKLHNAVPAPRAGLVQRDLAVVVGGVHIGSTAAREQLHHVGLTGDAGLVKRGQATSVPGAVIQVGGRAG